VALFVSIGVQMTADVFVEFGGSRKAAHATQRRWLRHYLKEQPCSFSVGIT
jgi:hypothetical protein